MWSAFDPAPSVKSVWPERPLFTRSRHGARDLVRPGQIGSREAIAHYLAACLPPSYNSAITGETEDMSEAKRKLLVILTANVAGYWRLKGDYERATMDGLK